MEKKSLDRRTFFSNAAIVSTVGALGMNALFTSCSDGSNKLTPLRNVADLDLPNLPDRADDGRPLKVGLVGCGGRGSGAVQNILDAAPNVQITALGDLFQEPIDNCRKLLKEKRNIDIPAENCFTGFDNYKKVIATDVDIVILATPPGFRPIHFAAIVDGGKHAFIEKPLCVDPVGARSIIASAKKAESMGLCVVTGTQRHHQRCYIESFKQIQSGLIGDIVSGCVYWNGGPPWFKSRDKSWSDMEYMIHDWVNWVWLCGDHILEQHVHNIDVFNWFSGKKPVNAVAFGARQRQKAGDKYDMFSVDFVYEGGIHVHSMCRQINGCSSDVSESIQGTKGSWSSKNHEILDLQGKVIWKFDFEKEKSEFKQTNPYVLEHVNLVNHIRANKPINQAEETAISTLTALLGREAAYTGATLNWDDVFNSPLSLLPDKFEFGPVDMSKYVVRVPGTV